MYKILIFLMLGLSIHGLWANTPPPVAELEVSSKIPAAEIQKLQKRLPKNVVLKVVQEDEKNLITKRTPPATPQEQARCWFPKNKAPVRNPAFLTQLSKKTLGVVVHQDVNIKMIQKQRNDHIYQFCNKSDDHLSRYFIIRYLYQLGDFANVRLAVESMLTLFSKHAESRFLGLTDEQTSELLKMGFVAGWLEESATRRTWIYNLIGFARKIRPSDSFWIYAQFMMDVSDPNKDKAKANFQNWNEGEELDKTHLIFDLAAAHVWDRTIPFERYKKRPLHIIDWMASIVFQKDLVLPFLKEKDLGQLDHETQFILLNHGVVDLGIRILIGHQLTRKGLMDGVALAHLYNGLFVQSHVLEDVAKSLGTKIPSFLTKVEADTLVYETARRAITPALFILMNKLYANFENNFLNPQARYVSWVLLDVAPTVEDKWFAPKAARVLALEHSPKALEWKTLVINGRPIDWMLIRLWWYISPQWKNPRHILKTLVEGKPYVIGHFGKRAPEGLRIIRTVYEELGLCTDDKEWSFLSIPPPPDKLSPEAAALRDAVMNNDALSYFLLLSTHMNEALRILDAGFMKYTLKGQMKFVNKESAYQLGREILIRVGL